MAHAPGRLIALAPGPSSLRAHLYRPEGAGPFAAMVFAHGSERAPGAQAPLGRFYTSAGYVLLVPHRRGHGCSPGPYELDEIPERARQIVAGAGAKDLQRTVVDLVIAHHERRLADTVAAIRWLRAQPDVDPGRIAVSGVSFGATQALLAAEGDAGAFGYVAFSPSATAWTTAPALRERLLRAVRAASAPTLLIQASNDHDLGPSAVLGPELERRGAPSRARIYPSHGASADDGHGAFAREATGVWGPEVLAFLAEALARRSLRSEVA